MSYREKPSIKDRIRAATTLGVLALVKHDLDLAISDMAMPGTARKLQREYRKRQEELKGH